MRRPVIALLTDYGTEDFFVASLKGVILSLQPEAEIVDIAHTVPSFDLRRASYLLAACYKTFPAGTIFVVVVDPGVGTGRRILVAKTRKYFFVAPDNGVLTGVLKGEKLEALIRAENERYFLAGHGRTFDGRDKMAPLAAWLSHGCSPKEFGPRIASWKKMPAFRPRFFGDRITGHIVHIDKFGNCLTDVPTGRVRELEEKCGAGIPVLTVGGASAAFRETYAEGQAGELIFLPGSQGTIEIAVKQDSAAAEAGAAVGDSVLIRPARRRNGASRQLRRPAGKP